MSQAVRISLDTTHRILDWPSPTDVTHPKGTGASVYADLVREKIGRAVRRYPEASSAKIGVLMSDPDASTSEPPIAIVVEFQGSAHDDTLRELHRLCWNFSHAPTLITVEPALLRVWSCCEAPDPERGILSYIVQNYEASELLQAGSDDGRDGVLSLHWLNLVSGHFFSAAPLRFDRDGRADQMLLSNLRFIRNRLSEDGLVDDDICHDLLARIIFVQFLFDRKDQDGNAALTAAKLQRLQKDGVLKKRHSSLETILADYNETYRLFDWLNTKFNGDLFPGKGNSARQRSLGWAKEKAAVRPAHLNLLAEFIRGDLELASRQLCLWPQYAFDVIPLEFISSIYETFVTERASSDGIFYTPPHLVDFVLDRVLPWGGAEWDLKIIDPACGSGIFLVKSFQRLVHRWKQGHPGETIRAEVLRRLLEKNMFGVDKDPHAVRVACFSLYLAMCDEIEPRHYWTQVSFPSMRESRLICSDFFSEDRSGFSTAENAGTYDLVVGNAPWGDGVITERAEAWAVADDRSWSIANNDIGGLFLVKGATLTSPEGTVALIQSANSLLFNISTTALNFRKELFAKLKIDSIFNLSALRFRVFKRKTHTTKTSAAPACVFILKNRIPDLHGTIDFVSPKHVRPLVDEFTIVVEPLDQRSLTVSDAINDLNIWTKLMWGNARDLQLLKKLAAFPSLATYARTEGLSYQQGVTFGDRQKPAPHLDGRRLFDETMFPAESILHLDSSKVDTVKDISIHSRASMGLEAFAMPQLILKHSWNKPTGRFHARLTVSKGRDGVLCNQSYLSIHGRSEILESACIAHNSKIAVYYHLLTSGRFAAYRPKLSKDDMLNLPIPRPAAGLSDEIASYRDIDEAAYRLFGLKDAERVLIEDAIDYTLDDFLGGDGSNGKASTKSRDEAHLRAYCEYFTRVLKAGFGHEVQVSARIYQSRESSPYRLLAFELGSGPNSSIELVSMRTFALFNEIKRLNGSSRKTGSLLDHRVARVYEANGGVPTVFLVKPDQRRFWTRSMALQDADEVATDIFRWQQAKIQPRDEAPH